METANIAPDRIVIRCEEGSFTIGGNLVENQNPRTIQIIPHAAANPCRFSGDSFIYAAFDGVRMAACHFRFGKNKIEIASIGRLLWEDWCAAIGHSGIDRNDRSPAVFTVYCGTDSDEDKAEAERFLEALTDVADADGAIVVMEELQVEFKGFPALWELFGYCLSKKVRERIFEPAFNDLMAQYLKSRSSRYRGWAARCCLNASFTIRTFFLVLECMRVTFVAAGIAALLSLIPESVQHFVGECLMSWFKRGP